MILVSRGIAFYRVCVGFLLLLTAQAHGSSALKYSDCFNQADTYYQQIYCEIKAQGEGASLPSFSDFKKNNEQMQALLLKRKAEALRIPFKMPTNQSRNSQPKRKVDSQPVAVSTSRCEYLERSIKCNDGVFSIVANQSNTELKRSVLNDSNKLALERFSGDRNNETMVLDHLTKSYTRYIEKMLEIGLGGSTMSFTKFYYLYEGLSDQGVDFEQRFETMYAYLKLDKRNLAVTREVSAIQGLSIDDCSRLKKNLFTCDNKAANRVYIK